MQTVQFQERTTLKSLLDLYIYWCVFFWTRMYICNSHTSDTTISKSPNQSFSHPPLLKLSQGKERKYEYSTSIMSTEYMPKQQQGCSVFVPSSLRKHLMPDPSHTTFQTELLLRQVQMLASSSLNVHHLTPN